MKTIKKLFLMAVGLILFSAPLYAQPEIEIQWRNEAGYPDTIDWNRYYIDLWYGGPYQIDVVVFNRGDEPLRVTSSCSLDVFTVDEDEFEIAAGESNEMEVIYDADEPGLYQGALFVESNDPENGLIRIPLHASSTEPPIMVIHPYEIEELLRQGETSSHIVNIANESDGLLRWVTELEVIQEPGLEQERLLRDDLGDIERRFSWQRVGHHQSKPAIAHNFNLDLLLVATEVNGWTAILDPFDDYAVVREWQSPGPGVPISAAALDNEFLILQSDRRTIQRWSADGQFLGNQPLPDINEIDCISGLLEWEAFGALTVGDGGAQEIPIISSEGEVLSTIRNLRNVIRETIGSIAFGTESETVWLGTEGRIFFCVTDYRWIGNEYDFNIPQSDEPRLTDGLAVGASGLILGTYDRTDYVIVEDGMRHDGWVHISPREGILAGGYDMDVTVTLSAERILPGEYEADLHFYSNDPANPDNFVSIRLIVMPGPVLDLKWSENAYPDSLLPNDILGELFTGIEYILPLALIHAGNAETVRVDSVISSTQALAIDIAENTEIEENDTLFFNALISSEEPVNERGTIRFSLSHNDGFDSLIVPFRLEIIYAPVFEIDQTVFEVEEPTIEDTLRIRLTNSGRGDLRWHMKLARTDLEDEVAPGTILDSLHLIHGGTADLSWDSESDLMWAAHHSPPFITAYRYDDEENRYEIAFDRGLTNNPTAIAVLGNRLYASNYPGYFLYIFDREGNLVANPRMEFQTLNLAAIPESNLLMAMDRRGDIHILNSDSLPRQVNEYSLREGEPSLGAGALLWSKKWEGSSIIINTMEQLTEVELTTSNDFIAVGELPLVSDHPWAAIEFDGRYLWHVPQLYGTTVHICQPYQPIDVHAVPYFGEIAPESSTEVGLVFELNEPEVEGEESYSFEIESNDPFNNLIQGQITVHRLAVTSEPVVPNDFAFAAPFPNPFNGMLNLRFYLGSATNVKLTVFDLAGREVAQLVNGELNSGNHNATWNAADFSSGLYLIKMETPQTSRIHKATLIK